jgi:hypothetical protein
LFWTVGIPINDLLIAIYPYAPKNIFRKCVPEMLEDEFVLETSEIVSPPAIKKFRVGQRPR